MKTETTGKSEKTSKIHPSTSGKIEYAEQKVEASFDTLLPVGSWRRLAAGVAAAAGAGLFAAAWIGAGPAAIAGTAGYLAYRKLSGERKTEPSVKH